MAAILKCGSTLFDFRTLAGNGTEFLKINLLLLITLDCLIRKSLKTTKNDWSPIYP